MTWLIQGYIVGKYENAVGLGFFLALLTVPLSLWAEVQVLPGFCAGFVTGFLWSLWNRAIDDDERSREELMWQLVGMKVARDSGWDVREYRDEASSWLVKGRVTDEQVARDWREIVRDKSMRRRRKP